MWFLIYCYLLAANGTALGLFLSGDGNGPKSVLGKALWAAAFGLIWPFTLALGITVGAER